MRKSIILFFCSLLIGSVAFTQKKDNSFKLSNVLVISQQNKLTDRYSVEGAVVRLFTRFRIKAIPSLNIIKQGGDPNVLLEDTVKRKLKQKGVKFYLIISVRGYDGHFDLSQQKLTFKEAIQTRNLFDIYNKGVDHVTFSFKFFDIDSGKLIHRQLIRTRTIGSKNDAMESLIKKLKKEVEKHWL